MTATDETHDAGEADTDENRTLDPAATIRSNYVFQRYDPEIERTISFRPASIERDLGRLHAWLGYDHVAEFWDIDRSLPAFRDHLAEKLAAQSLTPYVGCIDHVPMSYWEVYWPTEYELGAYYDAAPTDRAAHVLVGPPEYVGEGYAKALFRTMGTMLFSHPETERVVGEPDAANEIVIHLMKQCGFEARDEFYFEAAEKDARLLVCEREAFEEALFGDTHAMLPD